eukprot:4796607-Prymnesium_polylepis.2
MDVLLCGRRRPLNQQQRKPGEGLLAKLELVRLRVAHELVVDFGALAQVVIAPLLQMLQELEECRAVCSRLHAEQLHQVRILELRSQVGDAVTEHLLELRRRVVQLMDCIGVNQRRGHLHVPQRLEKARVLTASVHHGHFL